MLAADEVVRRQAGWKALEILTQDMHQRASDYSPAQIEAEIGAARAEVKKTHSSAFQQAIEGVEMLPVDDQLLLVEIIQQRLIQHRRSELIATVAEARESYQAGTVRKGTAEDLLLAVGTHDEVY